MFLSMSNDFELTKEKYLKEKLQAFDYYIDKGKFTDAANEVYKIHEKLIKENYKYFSKEVNPIIRGLAVQEGLDESFGDFKVNISEDGKDEIKAKIKLVIYRYLNKLSELEQEAKMALNIEGLSSVAGANLMYANMQRLINDSSNEESYINLVKYRKIYSSTKKKEDLGVLCDALIMFFSYEHDDDVGKQNNQFKVNESLKRLDELVKNKSFITPEALQLKLNIAVKTDNKKLEYETLKQIKNLQEKYKSKFNVNVENVYEQDSIRHRFTVNENNAQSKDYRKQASKNDSLKQKVIDNSHKKSQGR